MCSLAPFFFFNSLLCELICITQKHAKVRMLRMCLKGRNKNLLAQRCLGIKSYFYSKMD